MCVRACVRTCVCCEPVCVYFCAQYMLLTLLLMRQATMIVLYKLHANLKAQTPPPGVVGDGGREQVLSV